jgi:hypothetical protein
MPGGGPPMERRTLRLSRRALPDQILLQVTEAIQ